MIETEVQEFFIWALFQQLVRRNFAIGLEEYGSVVHALRAGFGWSSREELKQVLCALWATSRDEAAVVSALFDHYEVAEWNLAGPELPRADDRPEEDSDTSVTSAGLESTAEVSDPPAPVAPVSPEPAVAAASRLPPLRSDEMPRLPYSHVFLPQYPVSYRHIAQTWRRLRWPLREGPAIELDVNATVARRSRLGVGSPPVLRPRRRNQAHLLLLVDRKGSMAPFHSYVNEVCTAIAQAGRLGRMGLFYFHDTPLEGTDLSVLGPLEGQLFPSLDPILGDVPALKRGEFYSDPELLDPHPAESVLSKWTRGTAIVVISDAGAARGRLDVVRLLDSIASLKTLLALSNRLVWLNPMPMSSWARSTSKQIARHVPMFPMDRDGMHRAVNVLRGQPFVLERPLSCGGQLPEYTH
jgi:uncharacterized protein with von Willebrand factor type A (vWA) domain